MSQPTISVTLAVTASQLAQIAAIMGGAAAAATAPAPEPEETTTRRTRAKADDAGSAKDTEVKGKDKDGGEVDEVPSKEDVTKAAQALSSANGRDALVEMLGKFDAKNISGIAEEDRQKFIDACAKAAK